MERVNLSYFQQLVNIIDDGFIADHYSVLLKMLYDTEFLIFVDEDVNRLSDAEALRRELMGPVIRPLSFLEVLIALAKRCHEEIMYGYSFDHMESSCSYWFWIMINNCGLNKYTNNYIYGRPYRNRIESEINGVIQNIIERKYNYDGKGGLFPLKLPQMDQRFCELWYQMNAYLVENYPF